MTPTDDVGVIGAGPYGLAVSAELRRAGADVHVFGDAMSFWMQHMPKGMCLRSSWSASHIGDPRSALSLNAFENERATALQRPIPIADFVAYGHWFQARALPDLDARTITRIEADDGGFRITLADGEPTLGRRVRLAGGGARAPGDAAAPGRGSTPPRTHP